MRKIEKINHLAPDSYSHLALHKVLKLAVFGATTIIACIGN